MGDIPLVAWRGLIVDLHAALVEILHQSGAIQPFGVRLPHTAGERPRPPDPRARLIEDIVRHRPIGALPDRAEGVVGKGWGGRWIDGSDDSESLHLSRGGASRYYLAPGT